MISSLRARALSATAVSTTRTAPPVRIWPQPRVLSTTAPRGASEKKKTNNRVGEYTVKIEEKIGVGLRYRRPRVWDGNIHNNKTSYSEEDIKKWRAEFNLPFLSHSSGHSGSYTDEELRSWRTQFDAYASNGVISLASFHKLVEQKCRQIGPEELPSKVMQIWMVFDEDQNNSVDFGEFMKAGFCLDIQIMREEILTKGANTVFQEYADEGFICEGGIFRMMQEYNFFVTTTSDMRKLLKIMDSDKDGMVSKIEFNEFSNSLECNHAAPAPKKS